MITYCDNENCEDNRDGQCNRGYIMLINGSCSNFREKTIFPVNDDGEEVLPWIPKPRV